MLSKIRFHLEVSPQLCELVTNLAEGAGISRGALLRRAIVLMEIAIEAHKENKILGIFNAEGKLEREIVVICP